MDSETIDHRFYIRLRYRYWPAFADGSVPHEPIYVNFSILRDSGTIDDQQVADRMDAELVK